MDYDIIVQDYDITVHIIENIIADIIGIIMHYDIICLVYDIIVTIIVNIIYDITDMIWTMIS
jgi:hypothetical protein